MAIPFEPLFLWAHGPGCWQRLAGIFTLPVTPRFSTYQLHSTYLRNISQYPQRYSVFIHKFLDSFIRSSFADGRWRKQQEETRVKVASESSHCGTAETNPTSNHKDADLIPGLTQWVKDPALP